MVVRLQPAPVGTPAMGTGPTQLPARDMRTLLPLACHLLHLGHTGAMTAEGDGTAGAPVLFSLAEACLQAALGLIQQGPPQPHLPHPSSSATTDILGLADCLMAAVGILECVGPRDRTPISNAAGGSAPQHSATPPAEWVQLELCALTIQAVALLSRRLDYLQQQQQQQTEAGSAGGARSAADEPRKLLAAVATATELQARVLSTARLQQLKAETATLLEQAKHNDESMKVCRGLASSAQMQRVETCHVAKLTFVTVAVETRTRVGWWVAVAHAAALGCPSCCSGCNSCLLPTGAEHCQLAPGDRPGGGPGRDAAAGASPGCVRQAVPAGASKDYCAGAIDGRLQPKGQVPRNSLTAPSTEPLLNSAGALLQTL